MAGKTVQYNYLPVMITRNWADGNGNVRVVSLGENRVGEESAEKVFALELIDDCPKEVAEGLDATEDEEFCKMIERLIDGDNDGDSLTMRFVASTLIFVPYHCAPSGLGRLQSFALKQREEILKKKDFSLIERRLEKYLDSKRKVSEVSDEITESEIKTLLSLDLSVVFLEAPESSSFVLSENPFCPGNLLSPDSFTGTEMRYFLCGTFYILPLTPKRALCIYDDYVYKLRKKDGRIVLNPDDMETLNRYFMSGGTKYVVTEDFPYDDNIPEEYRAGEGNVSITDLSFFQIRARGLEKAGDARDFPVDFISDTEDLEQVIDENPDDTKEIILAMIEKAERLLGMD